MIHTITDPLHGYLTLATPLYGYFLRNYAYSFCLVDGIFRLAKHAVIVYAVEYSAAEDLILLL
jgi:hypothetical protein